MPKPHSEPAYEQLEQHFGKIGRLQDALAILQWDTETMMPAGAVDARAEQLAAMEGMIHRLITDPALAELFETAETTAPEDPWQKANLVEMQRRWIHERALEPELVEALSRATTDCVACWRQARPQNDFAAVRPKLETLLSLTRQKAAAKAEALGLTPYEALLDEYEPNGRTSEIDRVFDQLASFLPDLIDRVIDAQAKAPRPKPLKGPFDTDKQQELGRRLMELIGFDFEHGRLDISHHPFCGGVPDDVRITTRYTEADFTRSMMAVVHETGHALYERGRPAAWRYQPVGQARGMSMHESQSLLIEMQACRSRAFLHWAAPILEETFAGSLQEDGAWSGQNLFRLFTRVQRSLIRVDADEVTYPTHVIMRYRLEQKLIAGELEVAELPTAWNSELERLVGITAPDDRDGCMQDIHWYTGVFGYFPTYTLGAMTAAQLFESACSDSAIADGIGEGNFAPLLGWLRTRVHERASSVDTATLIVEATGQPLSAELYRKNLERRYLAA